MVNPANDVAAHRVINVPKRGIGKTTVEHIDYVARETGITFLQAAELCIADDQIRSATRKAIAEPVALIHEARRLCWRLAWSAIVDKGLDLRVLEAENSDDAAGRIENIQELFGVVDEYAQTHDDADALFEPPTSEDAPEADDEPPVRTFQANSLPDFVEWVTLRTDMDTVAEDGEAITMMTIHAAKGLEFDCVFVAGMEESLFPHGNSSPGFAGLGKKSAAWPTLPSHPRASSTLPTPSRARSSASQAPTRPRASSVKFRWNCARASEWALQVFWLWLGKARQPSRHCRLWFRGGRRSRVRPVERFRVASSSAGTPCGSRKPVEAAAGMTFAKGDTVDHKVFGRGTITRWMAIRCVYALVVPAKPRSC